MSTWQRFEVIVIAIENETISTKVRKGRKIEWDKDFLKSDFPSNEDLYVGAWFYLWEEREAMKLVSQKINHSRTPPLNQQEIEESMLHYQLDYKDWG